MQESQELMPLPLYRDCIRNVPSIRIKELVEDKHSLAIKKEEHCLKTSTKYKYGSRTSGSNTINSRGTTKGPKQNRDMHPGVSWHIPQSLC
jgi:hypothetical protein